MKKNNAKVQLTNISVRTPFSRNLFGSTNYSVRQEKRTMEKANEQIIEKGLMYGDKLSFIKTGKELLDKLAEQNAKYKFEISLLEKKNSELKKKIGSEPDTTYEYYDYTVDQKQPEKPYYSLSNDDRSSVYAMDRYNDVSTESDDKLGININKMKINFNSNIRQICSLLNKIDFNDSMLRNIKPKQKVKLSPIDIRELGF